ncbi:amidase [Roseospira marina]|uniref:Amidase n=1 Tax=Roseospira marina TaxID=140057 RepID=A0A5M6IAI0_9PROT|nr:amidase [Roseospira marina]KAA5605271.1 amidase [Roseospira marina]MBB4314731.1 aspartyl-tRNA(Asn)/glutamyl-tRNA(Gln) amidotransferase subunit A [Roseospira marina]MBB5087720.1 aspartyl-tRNA(Asn)/glutamyl-tRNA(Gln) amidotransferase subunit A [Roseospira marina]
MTDAPSLRHLAHALDTGETTSRALVETCLERIADPAGEGQRVYLKLHATAARQAADAFDQLRQSGLHPHPLAGVPISIKDLLDEAGQVTRAGSRLLADAAPAERDALVVTRLRAAGLIVLGRTNMTEFAFSGVGLNPHHGTPLNPWDRATGRIPGGSSSGAAVSVTDGMAYAAIGTDTGGSCRIPAAVCGLVGFKPTARRVPRDGVFPLAYSLDSVGPLARTVDDCAMLDAILSGTPMEPLPAGSDVAGLRLGVPTTVGLDGMDADVTAAFTRALDRLSQAGARIIEVPVPAIAALADLNAQGGLSAAESYAIHRTRLAEAAEAFDPRVRVRIERGAAMGAADLVDVQRGRIDLSRQFHDALAPFDAFVWPTVPTVAPPVDALRAEADYVAINMRMLRNPSVVNMMDACALSLPCHTPGDAPVGLMLIGPHGGDRRLLALAQAVEGAVGTAAIGQAP